MAKGLNKNNLRILENHASFNFEYGNCRDVVCDDGTCISSMTFGNIPVEKEFCHCNDGYWGDTCNLLKSIQSDSGPPQPFGIHTGFLLAIVTCLGIIIGYVIAQKRAKDKYNPNNVKTSKLPPRLSEGGTAISSVLLIPSARASLENRRKSCENDFSSTQINSTSPLNYPSELPTQQSIPVNMHATSHILDTNIIPRAQTYEGKASPRILPSNSSLGLNYNNIPKLNTLQGFSGSLKSTSNVDMRSISSAVSSERFRAENIVRSGASTPGVVRSGKSSNICLKVSG